ncbi:serine hydrolase domain-containing protein [Phytomonospora endophytica]|uniref:D-alanyl-D-alanine carboxypeptidase n=1 Tax=Phytomonospora endophytica TaxID=714109 RepID=A0A841FMT5_9ACTN|nr:serine hydrolase domain-containing protein [Phytomonospora endophytica]MBB6033260.1 D-alanyl-D-alanine carboxypeptidase [Phytomonospora endophytica]
MTRKRILTAVLTLAVAAGLGVTALDANAEAPPKLPGAELQAGLDALVDGGAASAALLRVDDGRSHWSGAAGTAELNGSAPADPRGHFRIGSVTKSFVATVVLQLVDEGLLGLDDPIGEHLPGLVPGGGDITVRQILDHSSGLHDYMSEPGMSTNRWRGDARFDSYEPGELLDIAFATTPDEPEPGWHYSNTNYIVAGVLVERLTGNTLADEIGARILDPLRMRHTSLPGDDPSVPEPHAHGYTTVDGAFVDATEQNPSLDWAAGEMISTTADLNRFFGALLGGRLTSPEALQAMRTTVPTGTIFEYGLGLQEFALPCGTTATGHGGQLLGYLTYSLRTDDGRVATLNYNPYERGATQEEITSILATALCRAA